MSQTSLKALKKRKNENKNEGKGDKKVNDESDEERGYGPALVVIPQENQYLSNHVGKHRESKQGR
jgi:hypothetical protein